MNEFCDNPHCDNPGVKEVPVSVKRASDQVRTLCAPCEEAYTWGLQHGQMAAEFGRVNAFLKEGGFILLAENREDPNRGAPLEAWAYSGELNFDTATPMTFGLGANLTDAIGALDHHLTGQHAPSGLSMRFRPAMLRANDRELATILAALRFHQAENLQGSGEILDRAIGEIATDTGKLTPLDFHEVEDLCEKLNCGEFRSPAGLTIEPPHEDSGDEPLFRVVYAIDLNAVSPAEAARQTHGIMADPESQPPVLEVIDHSGKAVSIDLSEERPA